MKDLLVISLALFAGAGLWSVVRNGPTKHLSVSLHVARARLTQVVFGIVVFIGTILMAVNFFGWLLPHYGANWLAYVLYGCVVGCFLVVAMVPHIQKTWREPVHNFAAWGLVCLIPSTIALSLGWPLRGWLYSVVMGLLLVECVLLGLALWRKDLIRWFLYFQLAYLAVFFGFLLAVIYY